MKTEKGQGLVDVVLGLGLIAFLVIAAMALFSGPAARNVAQEMANVDSKVGNITNEVLAGAEVVADSLTNDSSWSLEDQELFANFSANGHAIAGHAEALEIQECLRAKGPQQLWRDRSTKNWYAMCQLNDGRWGMMVCTPDGKTSKTAYVPRDGSWNEVLKYLVSRGTLTKMLLPGNCD